MLSTTWSMTSRMHMKRTSVPTVVVARRRSLPNIPPPLTPADVKLRGPGEAAACGAKSCYTEYMLDVMVVALFQLRTTATVIGGKKSLYAEFSVPLQRTGIFASTFIFQQLASG
jgi:hypothetical protein